MIDDFISCNYQVLSDGLIKYLNQFKFNIDMKDSEIMPSDESNLYEKEVRICFEDLDID